MSYNFNQKRISHSPRWSKTAWVSHPNLNFHSCHHSSRWTLSSSTTTTTTTTIPSPNKPAAPPPSSLRFLLNQGLSLAEAEDIKEKCGKFSTTLRSNTVPVRYNRCNKGYHQKRRTGPKASFCNINWNCNKFAKILHQSSSANITHHLDSYQLSLVANSQ